jgi:hypothetical protein
MDITNTQSPGMIGFFLGYTAFGIWSLLRKGGGWVTNIIIYVGFFAGGLDLELGTVALNIIY